MKVLRQIDIYHEKKCKSKYFLMYKKKCSFNVIVDAFFYILFPRMHFYVFFRYLDSYLDILFLPLKMVLIRRMHYQKTDFNKIIIYIYWFTVKTTYTQ